MFRKAWSWIRGLSDLVTLAEFAGSLGLAGFLAIVGQGAIGAALQLSPVLRLLLSVCIFLVVLAAALAVLKAVLEKRPAQSVPQDSSVPAGPYPFLEPHEYSNQYFKNRSINIAEFAQREGKAGDYNNAVVKNRVFEDCRIYGPAVFYPKAVPDILAQVFVGGSKWSEGRNRVFWIPCPKNHPDLVGIIGLEDCIFRDCRFTQVGVLCGPDVYEHYTGTRPQSWWQGARPPDTSKEPT